MAGTLHDVHAALGARFAALAGTELPRSYGDPVAEYDAIRHGAALVDRGDLAVIRVFGRDPVRMIQGLVTNDVAAGSGNGVYAAFLTPKGRMVADARILRAADEVWLITSRVALEPLMAHLRKFIPPLFARFEPAPRSVIGVYGPAARAIVAGAGTMQPEGAGAVGRGQIDGGDVVALFDSRTVGDGVELVAADGDARSVWSAVQSAGARPAGHAALDVARIEEGRPAWGAELGEAVIPLEAGLRADAISETKGCYTGQEVIVRILHRGHVNRHLRGLMFGELPAPARGTALFRAADGRQVGEVTSACQSPRFDQAIGLGYVRREVEPAAVLRAGAADGPELTVAELPFTAGSIPASSHDPIRHIDS